MHFKNFGNIAICALMLIMLALTSCNGCKSKRKYAPRPAVETAEYPIKLERFEQELFGADTAHLIEVLTGLSKKYGVFYTSYANDIMQMPNTGDSLFTKPMRMLLSLERLHELQRIVDSNFNDLTDIEQQLSKAMGVYHQEFPKAVVPKFTTFISEFGNGNVIYEDRICIGLDFYMNKRFAEFYRALEFPEFMVAKMERKYIVPNAIKALAIGQYDYQTTNDKRFLAQILVEGKIRYFMKSLLPEVHDTIIMGYTQNQLTWCEENELQIWTHFIDKNMLYSSEPGKFMRYLNDGPFTVAEDVPKESSPAIGAYVGWQIINHYMEQNPKITLHELMNDVNFDKILKLSKYKPK